MGIKMSKIRFWFCLLTSSIICLTSCSKNKRDDERSNSHFSDSTEKQSSEKESSSETRYVIKWANYEGSILELDAEVKAGTIPSYDGPVPEKAGSDQFTYEFTGWLPEVKPVCEDITYTAVFSSEINHYTIMLDPNGGEISKTQIDVKYDSQYTLPIPTKDGYTFVGWFDGLVEMPLTGVWKYPTNKLLTAKWAIVSYTITYNLDDGINSPYNPKTYTIETDTIVLKEPTKTGYSFNGWYDSADKHVFEIAIGSIGNIVLYARWVISQYTITYNLNGGYFNDNPESYTFETETFTLNSPKREYYVFRTWHDTSTGLNINQIRKGTTGDKVLEALWYADSYSIKYILNGGTSNSSNPNYYSIESETIILKPSAKAGYEFAGWFNQNGEEVVEIPKGSHGDLTLTARWISNEYQIHLDPNGGYIENTIIDVFYGSTYSLPNPEPRLGYSFLGWFIGDVQYSEGTFNYLEDKYLTARWQKIAYSINYNLNGGENSEFNPSSYTIESRTIFLQDPIKIGYSFLGWFDNNNEQISSIPSGSNGNVELYARWSPNLNLLSIVSSDTSKGSVSIISGTGFTDENIIIEATPNDDCVFKGWFYNSNKISSDPIYSFTMPAESYSLMARFNSAEEEQWERNQGIVPVTTGVTGSTVTFGLYPKSIVSSENVLRRLDSLIEPETNGYYYLDNNYYLQCKTGHISPNDNRKIYDDKRLIQIENYQTYWFKCEPITWTILSKKNNDYYLLSSLIVDGYEPGTSDRDLLLEKTIVWLNTGFYESAFGLCEEGILETSIYNNTNKVFMPSYSDYKNYIYGFTTNDLATNKRCCRTSDWSRARGTNMGINGGNDDYLNNYYGNYLINYSDKYIKFDGSISGFSSLAAFDTYGIRPSIVLRII